jgi:hypothetical protein
VSAPLGIRPGTKRTFRGNAIQAELHFRFYCYRTPQVAIVTEFTAAAKATDDAESLWRMRCHSIRPVTMLPPQAGGANAHVSRPDFATPDASPSAGKRNHLSDCTSFVANKILNGLGQRVPSKWLCKAG